jgi:hypothetical protein
VFNRVTEPEYCEMRRNILAQLVSGRLTEDSDLSQVLDSLELVELTMEVEESGVEPAIEIKTVRDFSMAMPGNRFSAPEKRPLDA